MKNGVKKIIKEKWKNILLAKKKSVKWKKMMEKKENEKYLEGNKIGLKWKENDWKQRKWKIFDWKEWICI